MNAATKFTAHNATHNATHNEGGEGFNPHAAAMNDDAAAQAEARIQSLMSRLPEVRAAWAAAVAKYSRNGQLACADLRKVEAEAGITQSEVNTIKGRMAAGK